MGYQIFTGHRLESLVEEHQERFRSPFFGPRPGVVLQSQSLAQWLKLFLAQSTGGYASPDLLFQDEALRRLLAAHTNDRLLFLDELKYALYRHLSRVLEGAVDPVYRPLTAGARPDPARLFELADHIAGTFHNYAMNSELWPAALSAGVLPAGSSADPAAFAWQSRLWREVLGESGTLAGVAMERLTRDPPKPIAAPPTLLLVGSAFLSRRAALFLRSWADAGLVDVVHLLLLPAPAETLLQGPTKRPWSSWGTFGRAFLQSFPLPGEGTSPLTASHALGRLQAALATGLSFPAKPDQSLEVISAPHPLRELEAVRDRLLDALAADPTLQLHEIAVLAPDINVYAPFLDAAFGSDDPGRHLRHHVIDLDLGRENAWFRALDALLALVSGTIDRPTLFALIDTPAFQERWDLEADERELWLDYTEEVSAWREEGWGEPVPQSWSASWDRLFTGWFRTEAEGAAPIDTSPSSFRALGRFHALLQTLAQRGREARRPRAFLEWVRFLDQTIAEFLTTEDGTGTVLASRLRTLAIDAGSPEESLPWAGFRAFVQDQIAHFPGRRGQLLTEGLHCSSLRPLRAIPFRVIAVLGLDEGRYPRSTPAPSFDLRRHEPGQEEISSLALDRYAFWETLLSARDRLILSYQGRSAVDGSVRPPSPVLADLLDYLEEGGVAWPISQVPVKDFAAWEERVWSPRTLRRLQALSAPTTELPIAAPEPIPVAEAFPEVHSAEIVEAFTAPIRFHLKRVRQLVLRDEDRRGVDDEEPWSLPFLERRGWLQEGLRRRLAGQEFDWNVDAFVNQLAETGRVREGVFAERDRRELATQAAEVSAWADELHRDGWAASPTTERKLWAGRPWAIEPPDRFARGTEVLLPRLLYARDTPARTKIEAAVRLLFDPGANARLATLNPSGERRLWTWTPDAEATRQLAARAEAYWLEAAATPLPFYPDLLETLAKRRRDQSEPWARSVEESWRSVRAAVGVRSEGTLTRCPYAALAYPGDPDPGVATKLEPWWNDLLQPLLEAWQ